MNWNYRLSSTLLSVKLRFNRASIVAISPNGQAGSFNASFRQRFSVSATPQSVSLLISKVTTADDKSNGEFSCELNDLAAASWRRAIQVQVVGKLKSFADFFMLNFEHSLQQIYLMNWILCYGFCFA